MKIHSYLRQEKNRQTSNGDGNANKELSLICLNNPNTRLGILEKESWKCTLKVHISHFIEAGYTPERSPEINNYHSRTRT